MGKLGGGEYESWDMVVSWEGGHTYLNWHMGLGVCGLTGKMMDHVQHYQWLVSYEHEYIKLKKHTFISA